MAAALGWRAAFIIESVALMPFVLFTLFATPVHLHGSQAASGR